MGVRPSLLRKRMEERINGMVGSFSRIATPQMQYVTTYCQSGVGGNHIQVIRMDFHALPSFFGRKSSPYKMEMQIAVLKASVQKSLKHQLSARGQIGRIQIFCSTLVSQPLVRMWAPSAFIADRPAIVLGL